VYPAVAEVVLQAQDCEICEEASVMLAYVTLNPDSPVPVTWMITVYVPFALHLNAGVPGGSGAEITVGLALKVNVPAPD
jgi:hypothetical protein